MGVASEKFSFVLSIRPEKARKDIVKSTIWSCCCMERSVICHPHVVSVVKHNADTVSTFWVFRGLNTFYRV